MPSAAHWRRPIVWGPIAVTVGVVAALLGAWVAPLLLGAVGIAWLARRWGLADTLLLTAIGAHFVFFDLCRSPHLYQGIKAPFNFVWALLALSLIVAWTLGKPESRWRMRHDWLLYVVLIYILGDLFSVWVATWRIGIGSYDAYRTSWNPIIAAKLDDPVIYGVGGVVKNLGLYYLPLFILAARRDAAEFTRKLRIVVGVVTLIHLMHSVLTIGWLTGIVPQSVLAIRHVVPANPVRAFELFSRARGLFWNPNSLGFWLMIGLALLAARPILSGRCSRLHWAGLALVAIGIPFTGSRGAVLGAMVILCVMSALARRWRLVLILAGLSVAGIALLAAVLDLEAVLDRFLSVSAASDVGYSSRVRTFADTWEIVRDHWLWGIGYTAPVGCDCEYLMIWLRGGLVQLGARLLLVAAFFARAYGLFRTSAEGGVARELAGTVLGILSAAALLDVFAGGFYAAPFVLAPFYLMGLAIAQWHVERAQGVTEPPAAAGPAPLGEADAAS